MKDILRGLGASVKDVATKRDWADEFVVDFYNNTRGSVSRMADSEIHPAGAATFGAGTIPMASQFKASGRYDTANKAMSLSIAQIKEALRLKGDLSIDALVTSLTKGGRHVEYHRIKLSDDSPVRTRVITITPFDLPDEEVTI